MTKLLIEERFDDLKLNQEQIEGSPDKHLYIEGVYMQADLKNKNSRVYPLEVMKKAVDEYRNEWINTDRALGELSHPDTPELNCERACIKIIKLDQDPEVPSNFIGKARVLVGTPMGNIVKGLLMNGVRLGVSSRGLGSINEDDGMVSDLILNAIDVVHNPSAPEAMVKSIVENQQFTKVYSTKKLMKYVDEFNKLLKECDELAVKKYEKLKEKQFKEFLESL